MESRAVLRHKQTRCTYDALNEVITIRSIKNYDRIFCRNRLDVYFESKSKRVLNDAVKFVAKTIKVAIKKTLNEKNDLFAVLCMQIKFDDAFYGFRNWIIEFYGKIWQLRNLFKFNFIKTWKKKLMMWKLIKNLNQRSSMLHTLTVFGSCNENWNKK